MKLLIADDDPIILDLLVEVFIAYGFDDIVTVKNGAEALEAVKDSPLRFDFMLVDIQMPVMDGIGFCRAVRRLEGYADTPIVMITAMTDKAHVDNAFMAGATDYTTKPFDVRALVTQVRRAEKPVAVLPMAPKAAGVAAREYSDPAALKGQISGFVSEQALLNYARVVDGRGQYATVAVLITVHALKNIFDTQTPGRFERAVSDIAGYMFEALVGTQAVMTYTGDGQFLCLCDAQSVMAEQTLQDTLSTLLRQGKKPWHTALPDGPLVEVHPHQFPRSGFANGDPFFAVRALKSLKKNHPTRSDRLSKLFVMKVISPQLSHLLTTQHRKVRKRVVGQSSTFIARARQNVVRLSPGKPSVAAMADE